MGKGIRVLLPVIDSKTIFIGLSRTNHCDGERKRNTEMRGLPTEKEVGEQPQFSGEQDLALAYHLVLWMEAVSGVSSPKRFVSMTKQKKTRPP